MNAIMCTGRDGATRQFFYVGEYEDFDRAWFFRVFDADPRIDDKAFDLKFKVVNEATWQQVGIFHHSEPRYVAMGIPDALLPELKRSCGVQIISSPLEGESPLGEEAIWRSDDATKMWKRLKSKHVADFDEAHGVFFLL